MASTDFTPPPHARPSHTLTTPRLILRSALPDDAPAFTLLFSEPKNNPFGGVVGNKRTEEEQRANLAKQAASTARGENAWLVVVLKPDQHQPLPEGAESLRVSDGLLIGSTGFNEFKPEKKGEEEVLRSDIGALIDWRFQRKGYALETLEAVVEYGFGELGIEKITLETNAENEPFMALMEAMGMAEGEVLKGKRPDNEGDSMPYWIWKDDWGLSREKLKARKKWYL